MKVLQYFPFAFFQVWFGEHIFQPSFHFYKGYSIPVCKNVTQYMEYVDQLPLKDSPEAFGLHPNADITYVLEIIGFHARQLVTIWWH